MSRGEQMAAEGNPNSVEVLEGAAQASLQEIRALGGARLLLAPPESMPFQGPLREATQLAARVHLALGQQAERFAQRERAIGALTRAYRLAGPNRNNLNLLSRQVSLALGSALREGVPARAEDDTLDTLSSLALWKPRRFSFALPPGALGPHSSLWGTPEASEATPKIELLVTQGQVFPPESMTSRQSKTVVAPLYRTVAAESLPNVLRLGYMVAGYEKAASGPFRGQWELKARVFYPHPLFTRDHRDDRARAEALCAQLLRVRALSRATLGLENPYSPGGATDVWLNEVSALWPDDDDDPEAVAERGARNPKVNTKSPVARPAEIAETPLSMPWLAAGQMIGAPGDILFFKSGQPRAEAEWLREVAHEYGHVALAPAGIFRAPLEPFGNGRVGETLAMMWAAAAPASFDATPFAPPGGLSPTATGFVLPATILPGANRARAVVPASGRAASTSTSTSTSASTNSSLAGARGADTSPSALRAAALAHVARNAIPALRLWSAQGPNSPLRRDGTSRGQAYLEGFSVWAERVYGAPWLGAAMRPSLSRSSQSWKYNARILPTTVESVMLDFERAALLGLKGGGRLYLWLPGALESLPQKIPAAQIVNRAPLSLRTGERLAVRLFVPMDARTLHIDVRGVSQGAASQALRVEGFSAREAAGSARSSAIEVDVSRRSGWQRIVLAAKSPLTLGTAWMVR